MGEAGGRELAGGKVADPNLDINSTDLTFGNIGTKTGQRQFQAQLRLEF